MISLLILLIAITIIMFMGALGAFLFKLAANDFSFHPIKLLTNWYFLLAAAIYTIATLAYIYLLKYEELTILYPMASIQYVWATVLSVFFLKERITKEKVLALTLIIIGVIIISSGRIIQ